MREPDSKSLGRANGDRALAESLYERCDTEEAGAAGAAVEPDNHVVSGWLVLRCREEIVHVDEWLFLDGEVAAVHLELL